MNSNSNSSGLATFGVLGAILMGVGNFLPFATASVLFVSKTVNFIDGDGRFVLVTAILTAIFILANCRVLSLLCCWFGAAITFYDMSNASRIISDNTENLGNVSFEIGCYLIIIGVIITTIALFLMPSHNNKNMEKNQSDINDKASFCSNCGYEVLRNSSFCSNCGLSVNNDSSFCSNCGLEVSNNSSFCSNCGNKLK